MLRFLPSGTWHQFITDTQGILSRNPLRYRGYYYDTETGFYYLNARYYDPKVHRFISPEPNHRYCKYDKNLGINAYNLYAYCGNDPVNLADQTGEFAISTVMLCLAIGAVIGMAIGGIIGDVVANNKGYKGWDKAYTISMGIGIGGLIGSGIGFAIGLAMTYVAGIAGVYFSAEGIYLLPKLSTDLDYLNSNNINHIMYGSVKLGNDHKWYLLSPNMDWQEIKNIALRVLQIGTERIYKVDKSGTTYIRTADIDGQIVDVTYRMIDGVMKIGDAWVR